MTNILIIGATSAIAQATARLYAADGARFFLVGRDAAKLDAVRGDLTAVGAKEAHTYAADLNDLPVHTALVEAAKAALGTLDIALIAYGSLGNQQESEASVEVTLREWSTNATSAISLLTLLANVFEQQRHGTIAVLSSVAGDRSRRSLYLYSSAKAALDYFTEGLRGRLAPAGVAVVTIKPGLVDTPMTAHLPKSPLFSPPERVAADIHRAISRRGTVVYTPWFWRYVMLIVRCIPAPIFRRLPI